MIIIERISQLPKDVVYRTVVGKVPCEDADYCFFHKSLKFYSCYFNVPVVESKRKGKKRGS